MLLSSVSNLFYGVLKSRLRRIEYDRAESFAVLFFEYPGMDLKKFLRTEPEKASDPKLMKVRCPVTLL